MQYPAFTPKLEESVVRLGLVAVGLVVMSACTRTVVTTIVPSSTTGVASNTIGAASSRAAVEGFLTAVKSQDLQAMSTLWGTAKGAARDQMHREEMEKRLVIMQCLLMHDRWRFTEDGARLLTGGHQQWVVELGRKESVATTKFATVTGPAGRWMVEDVDVLPLKDFCR